jgi:hypothetical protein
VGFVIVSVLSGFWIAISQIADNTQRQVILQEQQLEAIKKLNRSLEAHRELQFPQE